MIRPEKLGGISVRVSLVLAGEVKVDIRHLISPEAEEGLERDIKAVLIVFFAAHGAYLIRHICPAAERPVKDKFGNWSGPSNLSASANYNPVAMAQLFNNRLQRDRIMGSFYGQFNFTGYLNLRTEYSFDSNTSLNKGFMPTYQFGVRINNINKIYQREEHSFYWIWKNYLNYNQTIGKHTIGAMLGMEMSRSAWEGTALQKNNLTNNDIQVMGEDGTYVTNSGWKDASTTMSVFARANYNYDNRYLITATIRGDASSKFGPAHRWGAFPSVALAWRISNEAWMRDVKQISNLKLRVGPGTRIGVMSSDVRRFNPDQENGNDGRLPQREVFRVGANSVL